jgi:single-stranded-DNA-specific exonuclease
VINEARREGLRALMRAARIKQGTVSASTIGFALGPRLNAAGRIKDASLSYKLLVTSNPAEAEGLARQLNQANRQRQQMTMDAFKLAEEMALDGRANGPILFAAHRSFVPGIVGLVAGRLTEAHYQPAVVVKLGDLVSTGSCRSIPEFNITRALDECRDLLVRYGGHAAAAGLTVENANLDELFEHLNHIAHRELDGEELAPTLKIDAEVALSEIDWATLGWLQELEPCGYANPTPLFLSRNVQVLHKQVVGSDKQHLKLKLGEGAKQYDAIAFRQAERASQLGKHSDVVYTLEANEWQGHRRLQLNVQDIQSADSQG